MSGAPPSLPPSGPLPPADKITAEHNQQPRFMATVELSVAPYRDLAALAGVIADALYDVDTAIGQQLDFTGQWIGATRWIEIDEPVWFSFDANTLGFDEGKWRQPYETSSAWAELDDANYRLLLYAKIVANYWDGTIEGAYAAWDLLLSQVGWQIVIQDGFPKGPGAHGTMNIVQALLGPPLDAVTLALFKGGYLGLKSAGVGTGLMIQNQGPLAGLGLPLFAFDAGPPVGPTSFPPTALAGFDFAAWGTTDLKLATERAGSLWDGGASAWDAGLSPWDVTEI